MRQVTDRIATYYLRSLLPILAFLTPLFFLPITVDFFGSNKRLLLFILSSLALIAWAIRNLTRKRLSVTYSPALLPLLGLTIVYIVSSFFQAPNYISSFLGQTSTLIALFIIFLTVTSSQKNHFVIKSTVIALIASISILSILSILQTTGIMERLISYSWLKGKFFTPAGGPLPFLTLSIPLTLSLIYFAFNSKNLGMKLAAFGSSALSIVGTITQLQLILPQTDQNRLAILPLTAGWSIAVDIFKTLRTSLLGTGPETFISAFTRLRPNYLNSTSFWDTRFTNSSNELFTILTTVGILSLFFILFAFVKTIISGIKTTKISHELQPFHRFSLILTILCFATFFVIPANIVLYTLSFVAIILLTLSLKLQNHSSIKDLGLNLYDQLSTTPPAGSYLLPLPVAILSIFGLLIFWKSYLPTYQAAIATFKAITTLNSNVQDSYQEQIKAYELDPSNPTYRINFSQTSISLANSIASNKDLSDQDKNNIGQLIQQSIREAKNATTLDPSNVTTWENLASIYRQLIGFAQGAPDWTIATYSQAILLDPTNARLRFELGGIYYGLGDFDTAIKLFEQSIERKSDFANSHYNLAAAYKSKKEYAKALAEMRNVLTLVQNNATDYDKALLETKELEKLASPAPTEATTQPETNNSDIKLVAPTTFPTNTQKPLPVPSDAAPQIPSTSPTPSTTTTPTPTPQS